MLSSVEIVVQWGSEMILRWGWILQKSAPRCYSGGFDLLLNISSKRNNMDRNDGSAFYFWRNPEMGLRVWCVVPSQGCLIFVFPKWELCLYSSVILICARFRHLEILPLLFPDDVVLMAPSTLQHSLGRFTAEREAAGIRSGTSKCKAMVISRNLMDCLLQAGHESLLQVKAF